MAAHDLSIHQITVVDIQDDNNPSPLDNNSFPTGGPPPRRRSPSETNVVPPFPTLNLTNYQNYLDVPGSPASRTSDTSSLFPAPSSTDSTHCSARTGGSRDNNPDGLSSSGFLVPPTRGHTPPALGIGKFSDLSGSLSLGLTLIHSCHRGVSMPPFPGSETSRPSSVASFFKRIIRCAHVHHLATLT
jgi:hypothetical protein